MIMIYLKQLFLLYNPEKTVQFTIINLTKIRIWEASADDFLAFLAL